MSNIIIRDIRKQINKNNQNFTLGIVGKLGSGKSYIGMRFCELVSPRFTLDNVVFSAKDFLKLLNSGKLKAGDSVMWDELSLEMFSRDFQSTQNKTLVHLMTVYRTMNLFTVFTCPSLSFIDIAVRRLLSAVVETISVNRKEQVNIFKYKRIQANNLTGEIRYIFPRVKGQHGVPVIAKKMVFKKSRFADAYDKRRKEYAKLIAKRSEDQLLYEEHKEARRRLTDADIIKMGNKEGIDWKKTNKVSARFGMSRHRTYRIQALLGV